MLFGIFIYDGVEPIDLATFGVLSMARRIAPDIEICTIGPRAGPITLANGLKVTADFGIGDAPIMRYCHRHRRPGLDRTGAGAGRRSTTFAAFMRRGRIASVCTGSMILAASGVLDDGPATTKREVVPPEMSPLEAMRSAYPRIDVREAMLVDRGGMLVTGGGVSLCIDTTLHLLAKMLGQHVADETARIMEYRSASRANREGFAPVLVKQ